MGLARTNISKLNLSENLNLGTLDVRKTKLSKLDLRTLDLGSFDARGTSVRVLVRDPKSAELNWQTTIDSKVKFATK